MIGPDRIRRVVLRLPNWVGDVIHCLPALDATREYFSAQEITLLARGEVGSLLVDYPAADRVISYPNRRGDLFRLWRVAAYLRSQTFDVGIVFTNGFEGALIFFLAGIPRRYGYATDGRRWLLTDPIPCDRTTKSLHQTDDYLALLRSLGIKPTRTRHQLRPLASERQAVRDRLLTGGWSPGKPLVAICPGASYGSAKRWPARRFAALAMELIAAQRATIVLVGGSAERNIGCEIAGLVRAPLLNSIGQTTLREALALLATCDLVVSNDSGLLHMAVAAGRPTVALFGPTDPDRTGPRGGDTAIIRKPVPCSPCEWRECPIDHPCMNRLSVDEVYDTVLERLNAVCARSPREGCFSKKTSGVVGGR